MAIPNITYTGVPGTIALNNPIVLTPVNTGGAPSPRLKISTVSGSSNNLVYPQDGSPNVATYRYPNSVSAKADAEMRVKTNIPINTFFIFFLF